MPKRLSDAELDAALAAGEPPRSEEYNDDGVWHAEQDRWLSSWQPGRVLPLPKEKQRRTEWDKLTKQHTRAFKAADDRRHQLPPAPPLEPKKRGAPRILTDAEREAAALRHKQAKREHSRVRTVVHRQLREEKQRVATAAHAARQAARQQLTPRQEPARVVVSRYSRCDTCQHVMYWMIPQRCMHCRMKDGSAPYSRWYASHWWGPFDDDGVCLCNCCKGTCPCVPCAERRGAECLVQPIESARPSSPASLYGECDRETEREIKDGYDEMQHDRMPGPEVERPDLPFEYGRFEDSTDCHGYHSDPNAEL